MDFAVYAWRFCFVAREPIIFSGATAGNTLRGGFGFALRSACCPASCPGANDCDLRHTCAYARIFEPKASSRGPSGLADWPRPFVLRAAHLDETRVAPKGEFHFDLHVFLRKDPELAAFRSAFEKLAACGLGPTRGRADLATVQPLSADGLPIILSLDSKSTSDVRALRISFLTPTELKATDTIPGPQDFATVFMRARDRVATLSALYGTGSLPLDFRGMGERARAVYTTSCSGRRVAIERRSSRTGQRHPIGGFVGEAEYKGELDEFIPILRAAEWTGIGRQTVWGKGAIRCVPLTA